MKAVDFTRVGKNIREKRKEQKFTQAFLAKQLGVQQSYISGIEQGKEVPSLTMLVNISRILECTPNDLLSGSLD